MQWVYNASPAIEAQSHYPTIVAVSITLTVLMSTIVMLRFYVRGIMLKSLGPDDWMILFGACCTISYNALCIGQTRWGLGLTIAARPRTDLDQFAILNYAGKSIYVGGIMAFKVSLCLSYLRILTNSMPLYRRVVWTILITCVCGHMGGAIVLIFLCKPIAKSWKPQLKGTCISNASTVYGLGAISIFYDLVILFVPIPMLMALQMDRRRRIGLLGVFCLGIFTTFCSIMRLTQIKYILATGDQTGLVMWATIEMNVGTSLTCLPTLIPLFKYYRDKITSDHDGSYRLTDMHSKSMSRAAMTNRSTQGWEGRDSVDNISQKQILGSQAALYESSSNENLEFGKSAGKGRGITTTTEVRVEVTDAEANGHARQESKSFKW